MIITQCLMSEHSSDSISNRLAQPGKNTLQKKYITRLEGHNSIDQLCDRENLLTDLPESWPYKALLHNKSSLISYGDTCQHVHQQFYILPRPSKAMAQWKFQYMQKEVYILLRPRKFQHVTQNEVHILSRPSKLQPVADYSIATQCTHREKDQDLPLLPSTLEAQETYTHKGIQLWNALYSSEKETLYRIPIQIKQNGVYHQASMLKIRCIDVRETRYRNSQSLESEKAKFQTPAIPNATRNCVKHNSAENISQDLAHPNKSDIEASASFDSKSEEREEITEIADVPAFTPAPACALERVKEQSHTPGSRKSMRKNFGMPASSFSDFYM